jgi:hypothetical protein
MADSDYDLTLKAMGDAYIRTWGNPEFFDLQRREPEIWADNASFLLHASNILNSVYQVAAAREHVRMREFVEGKRKSIERVPIYDLRLQTLVFYLRGLGIENLLKAILVAREQEPPGTHNLRELATKAGVSLTQRQQVLIDAMTANVVWHGRYHVPLKQKDMIPRPGLRDLPTIPGELGDGEVAEVLQLVDAIAAAYKQALEEFEPIRRRRSKAEWEKNQPDIPWPGDAA